MAPSPIKVGIIGYGASAKIFHIPWILPNPDLEIVAILQRAAAPDDKTNAEPGKHCTIDHPKVKHYRNADDFFADSDIDLVIVCSSSATHYEFGEKALKAGKHAVVEKPFTVTSAQADKLIDLAKQSNKILTVYQNRRYDSDFRTLQHLMSLKPNPFGKITEFATHYDLDNPEWMRKWTAAEREPGEGMLYGLGTHSLDQVLLLFGLPKSITAFIRVLRMENSDHSADDSFTIILQYAGEQKDLLVTVKTTVVTPQPKQLKYWVRGTDGSYQKYGEDVQVEHLLEFNKNPTDPDFGIEPERYHGLLYTKKSGSSGDSAIEFSGTTPSKRGSYMDYYRDLVAAIRGEKDLVVKPEQSREGIRIIELARESAEKGVTVPYTSS